MNCPECQDVLIYPGRCECGWSEKSTRDSAPSHANRSRPCAGHNCEKEGWIKRDGVWRCGPCNDAFVGHVSKLASISKGNHMQPIREILRQAGLKRRAALEAQSEPELAQEEPGAAG